MKYETLDEIYSDGDVTIFKISDYLGGKYGSCICTSWDVQDWGIIKSLFNKKKTGYEYRHIGSTGQVMVTFYDKYRETVEALEEELSKDKLFRAYMLLRKAGVRFNQYGDSVAIGYGEKDIKDILEGPAYMKLDGNDLVITLFANKKLREEESNIFNKLERFFGKQVVHWKTDMGVNMVDIVCDIDKFLIIVQMMANRGI